MCRLKGRQRSRLFQSDGIVHRFGLVRIILTTCQYVLWCGEPEAVRGHSKLHVRSVVKNDSKLASTGCTSSLTAMNCTNAATLCIVRSAGQVPRLDQKNTHDTKIPRVAVYIMMLRIALRVLRDDRLSVTRR